MANPTTTADRILEASLKLFNEHGFQSVPALKIAMHLGISPGNLAYHFKTKNDIVLAVFPRMEEEVRREVLEAVVPGETFRAVGGALHTIAVFRTLWRYRFFFDGLNHLLRDEPDLRSRYLTLQDRIIHTSEQVFQDLIDQHYMQPMKPPITPRTLARSWWMMWLGWLSIEQIEHPNLDMAPDSAIFEGALQSHSIVQLYFSEDFSRDFIAELKKALPGFEDPPPASKPAARLAVRKPRVRRARVNG